jgi:hypothetical protein
MRYAEPYMASGYEMLARREYEASARDAGVRCYQQATDPAWVGQQGAERDEEMVM